MNPATDPSPEGVDDYPKDFWPDVDDLVTEDDTPVDNIFSGKQQRLLTEPLYSTGLGRPFAAMANVGLFYQTHHPALVPDMLLSLDVEIPADVWSKPHRAYFVWEFGKPPEVVIEVVSNREGDELDSKVADYAAIGVKYYVLFDPERMLGERLLRLHELHGATYVERTGLWMPDIGLGLCLWDGTYEGMSARWLRWCDAAGAPIATGAEGALKERERAEQERERAKQERERAEQEHARAERMAQRLRALGIDPDETAK